MLRLAVAVRGRFRISRSATLRSVVSISMFLFSFILVLHCSGVFFVLLLPIPFLLRRRLSPGRRWWRAGLGWALSALFPVGISSPRFGSEPVWGWWWWHVGRVVRIIRICGCRLRTRRVWRANRDVHQRSRMPSVGIVNVEGHGCQRPGPVFRFRDSVVVQVWTAVLRVVHIPPRRRLSPWGRGVFFLSCPWFGVGCRRCPAVLPHPCFGGGCRGCFAFLLHFALTVLFPG